MSTLIPLGNLLRDYTTGDEILWAEDRAYLEHAHQDRLARIRDELAADSFPAVAVDHTELGSSTSIIGSSPRGSSASSMCPSWTRGWTPSGSSTHQCGLTPGQWPKRSKNAPSEPKGVSW